MFNSKLPVSQGTVGLAGAIYWLTKAGYTVLIPLVDNQSYDLVIEKEEHFGRVQVKTTRSKENGSYVVQLKAVRSNRNSNRIDRFDNTKIEYLFILTECEDMYLIPSKDITATCAITLYSAYDKYKVNKEG